jgi:hypothetical protein
MGAPSNGRFDLDAKRAARLAAQDEAAQAHWEFTFGGQQFSVKPTGRWPANAKRMLDNGALADFLDAVLDDPERFLALDPTNDDVKDLMDAYGVAVNVGDLPESAASPPPVSTPT